jgi:TRAP-type C4-dicarboxylate transport system permease small subunit
MEFLRRLERAFDAAIGTMAFLCGIILVFLMLSVCYDVIMRYVFNRPTSWVIEIAEYLLVYMTFLGAAWVLKQEGHVRVDALTMMLSHKAQAATGIISSVIGILVCLIIVWFGSIETWDTLERGVRNPSMLEFPKAPILAIIPVGSFFFMVQFIRRTFGFIKEFRHLANESKRSES